MQPDEDLAPRSIVAKAGKVRDILVDCVLVVVLSVLQVDPHVAELVLEMRRLMEPYTARNLREKSYNRMRDYVAVAGQLGVSHLLFFSQTQSNLNLRIARNPDGPTMHFRIQQFYLPRQIKALQRRPFESASACKLLLLPAPPRLTPCLQIAPLQWWS